MVRLLILGWDGASHNHLQDLQPDFYSSLPHGGRLLPEQVYRGIPIDSGTAWTTITTGLTVEQHGFLSINNVVRSRCFLGWTKQIAKLIPHRKLRTYFFYGLNKAFNLKDRTPRSRDVPYKRLWDYIDGRTLTFGVPLTYPAWKHNGVLLSGIPAPIDSPGLPDAYPDSYRKYRKRYNGYYYLDKTTPLEKSSQPNLEEYKERVYELNDEAFDVVEELATEEEFEVVFVVFPLIDDLLHVLDEEDDRQEIKEAYTWIDEKSQELVDALEPEEVLILSDHGMMPAEDSLNPDTYPGLEMDHDPMNGVWAATHDLDLKEQQDVTPAVLKLLGHGFAVEPLTIHVEDSSMEDISV